MNEIADSAVETETPEIEAEVESQQEPTDDREVNIEAEVDQIGEDLFGKTPDTETETEETEPEPEKAESEEVEPEPEEPEPEPGLERPQSWKKDMQETWDAMTKEAQEYVIQREEQMKAGLDMDRTDANLGRSIRDTLGPYGQLLQQNGVDEATAVRQLVHNHLTLARAPAEQKEAIFKQWAQGYGINLDKTEALPEDPRIAQLQNEINRLNGFVNNSVQQQVNNTRNEVVNTVNAFAESDEHPYFDELSDDIVRYINGGSDLEEAYQLAYKASDYYRLDLEKQANEKAQAEAKKQAEKAKQAKSVNVRSLDTGKKPTAPLGSMEDTLFETMAEIENRRK